MNQSVIRPKKQVVAVCGISQNGGWSKFLLLYRRGNYWNFPKVTSSGERTIDVALRELEEERG